MQTINRPETPEYILLEASGVADPSSIAVTFVDPELRERIRLDSITYVVDADQVFAYPEHPTVEQLKLRQIAFADMMILNKADLAGPQQVRKVRAWIDDHFSRLRIVETSYCDVPLEILLSVGRFDPARTDLDLRALEHAGCADANCHDEHHGHNHSMTFSTWSYETNRPLSLEGLRETARKLPGNIYRAKGVVHTSDAPDRRAVLRSSASVLTSRWKMSGATGRRAHRSWSSARVARWMARACGRNSPVAQRRSGDDPGHIQRKRAVCGAGRANRPALLLR